MKDYKAISIIMTVVFVLLLPLTILCINVQTAAFDTQYYAKEFGKYNIQKAMAMDMTELTSSAEKLLEYIQGKRSDLNFAAYMGGFKREFFSSRDKLHMIDVKRIFSRIKLLRNAALIYILVFAAYMLRNAVARRKLARYCIISAFVGLLPIAMLIILMNIDFYKYFTKFHHVFFTNDFWLLDPNVDTLVNMFPQDFFYDIALTICINYAAALGILLGVSLIYKNIAQKRA